MRLGSFPVRLVLAVATGACPRWMLDGAEELVTGSCDNALATRSGSSLRALPLRLLTLAEAMGLPGLAGTASREAVGTYTLDATETLPPHAKTLKVSDTFRGR